eukprot:CAMPEP_0118941690 /NCGR_PEP_ID=MMETSP1169-20130426/34448_1 /TAXON_ID=36882 /ORGANISM="Pyramimonas obovata, Strain CCMP722" /LENGTH=181 /DNA_ID=CAMNT_0006886519 /DNA_START=82 /DNA_END=624 /DNA_ORIENTATION=-
MPPSGKLCTRERVRHSPYARNEGGRLPEDACASPKSSSAIQRFAQNKQRRKLNAKTQGDDDSDEGCSSPSSYGNKSESSCELPDTEAEYFWPALDKFNEKLGTSFVGYRAGEESLGNCSGCGTSKWVDGDTYFAEPIVVKGKSGSRVRRVYCTICMQKKVGTHGDREEPEDVENDERMSPR